MTDQQIQKELCAFEGWVFEPFGDDSTSGRWHPKGRVFDDWASPPDYLNDLNAIARVEAKLDNNQQYKYVNILTQRVFVCDQEITKHHAWLAITSTARSRAIALIKVIK